MNKSFNPPFNHSRFITTYLLIEVGRATFLQFADYEDANLTEYRVPSLELDSSNDWTTQLAKYLYDKGLLLNSYRELTEETNVSFSFIDDTPGTAHNEICLHVRADRHVDGIHSQEGEAVLVSLDKMRENFQDTPLFPRTVELGIRRLQVERS